MLNKITSFLLVFILILFNSCKNKHEKNQEKELFEWNAYNSAPALRGPSFCFVEYFYKNKAVAGNSMCVGSNGWYQLGDGYANGGYKIVPDSVAINYICDLDLIEYSGGWKLPRKKMLTLFDSVKRPKSYYPDSEYGYRYIISGVAPGGQVKIWMAGSQMDNVEIAKFKAKPVKYFIRGSEEDFARRCGGEGAFIDDQLDDFYIYNYLHPIPYGIWDKEEKKYDVDFGFCYEGNPYISSVVHQSISKTGVLFDRWDNNPIQVEWNKPYGKSNLYDKIELPEQISFQAYAKDLGDSGFYAEIVLPQDFEAIFSKGYKDSLTGKQRFYNKIVFAIEKKSAVYNKYVYGKVQLDGVNKRTDVMRFRMVKKDTVNDVYYDTRYSLPKNFVFKKWNGRLPIKKLDFKYWQEK